MPQHEEQIAVSIYVSLHTIISSPTNSSQFPALLFLHYWGGSNATYADVISHLNTDFNIIAPSLRGWGQSSKPADIHAYRIVDYASDIVSLIRHLQARQPQLLLHGLILVGHSMGGKIAQYLLTEPVVQALIMGVVLLASAPAGSFSLPNDMREQQIHAYDTRDSAEFVIRNVLLGKPDAVDDAVVQRLCEDAVQGAAWAKAAWPAYGMTEDLEMATFDAVHSLCEGGRSLKVLVLVGEQDRVETPGNVEERVVKFLERAGAGVNFGGSGEHWSFKPCRATVEDCRCSQELHSEATANRRVAH